MSEISKQMTWFQRFQSKIRNPITVKELRGRMRGRRAFVVLTIYLTVMSGLITLVYLAYAAAATNPFGPSSRQAGKVVFVAVLAVQIFLVVFVGPAFTASAISGEKERQTYDLLRTTLLSARSLVNGKLLSALSYVFLLIIAAIPLQSIAFLLGGIAVIELVLSQLLVALAAISFALIGLFFSTIMRSTLAASVSTFATSLLLMGGAPIVASILISIMSPILFSSGTTPWLFTAVLIYGGLVLAATNLPATLVISDVILLQEDTLLGFVEVVDGHNLFIFSPWYGNLIIFALLSLLLYWICVRRVRRIPVK